MNLKLIIIVGMLGYLTIISAQDSKEKNSCKEDTIFLNLISIKAVNFFTTREELIRCLGKPDSIVNPHYECGGFSEDWQQTVFLQYYYGGFNYIGSEELYQIETINFDQDSTILLYYKDFIFSGQTKIDQLSQIFPTSFKNRTVKNGDPDQEIIRLLLYPPSDDIVFFYFKNGRLFKLKYWSPC